MSGDRAASAKEPARCASVDDRRVISGILHLLKMGCRWCDCPADYDPSAMLYNRFNRWSRAGFWLKLIDALVDTGVVTKSS